MRKLIAKITRGIKHDMNACNRWGNSASYYLFILGLMVGLMVGLVVVVFGICWGIIMLFPGISRGTYALIFATVVGVALLICYLINLIGRPDASNDA